MAFRHTRHAPVRDVSEQDSLERKEPRRGGARGKVVGALLATAVLGAITAAALLRGDSGPAVPEPVTVPKFGDVPAFSRDYSQLPPDSAAVISAFEGEEQWEGEGALDATSRFEGQTSMLLRSVDGRPASAVLHRDLRLARYDTFEASVSASNLRDIGALTISFGDAAGKGFFEFPVGALTQGWNIVRMPRQQFSVRPGAPAPSWDGVGTAKIELTSRPGTEVRANFDLLRAEGEAAEFRKDWTTGSDLVLGLMPSERGPSLLVRNAGASTATLAEVADTEDFRLRAEITPLTQGRGGLLLRGNSGSGTGYGFVIGGLGASNWQLLRTDQSGTVILAEGQLRNLAFRRKESYWLQATARGEAIEVAISRDGRRFVALSKVKDGAFSFGEVGVIALDASSLVVHQIEYKKL